MEILFIPVEILNKMALWLSEQQNDEGAFVETSEHYYDRSFWVNTVDFMSNVSFPPFSASLLLLNQSEGHLACKKIPFQ